MTKLYNFLIKPFKDYKNYLKEEKQREQKFTDMINEYVKESTSIKPENTKIYPVGKNLINKLKEIQK